MPDKQDVNRMPRVLLPALLSISIYVILFFKIDIRAIGSELSKVDIKLFALAIFISVSANIFWAAFRWKAIVESLGYPMPFKKSLFINTGSAPITFLFPLGTGDLVKALYIKRREMVDLGHGVSIILLDKIFNLCALLLILSFGLILQAGTGYNACTAFSPVIGSAGEAFKKKFSGSGNFVSKTFSVFKAITPRRKALLLAYSILLEASELVTGYIIFMALGLRIPLESVLIIIPLIIILGNLPVTISGLGIREAAVAFLFIEYGQRELLLGAGLLISFVEYIVPLLIGSLLLHHFLRKICYTQDCA